MKPLEQIEAEIVECRACPRLVAWREEVGRVKRRAFQDEEYWARPIPGFGDPDARLLIVGLAPAAHGGNRTGRVFTGDRSGDWLYAALHRAGFANQPTAIRRDDGLRLRDAWISACVRCAPPDNKPTLEERDRCLPYLERELDSLTKVRVFVCLGSFAWEGALRTLKRKGHSASAKPKFGHLAEAKVGGMTLIGSYHPSQQNTFTGRLTVPMFDAVFARANALLGK
jgi:uracil-DNA glycosylase family 4